MNVIEPVNERSFIERSFSERSFNERSFIERSFIERNERSSEAILCLLWLEQKRISSSTWGRRRPHRRL